MDFMCCSCIDTDKPTSATTKVTPEIDRNPRPSRKNQPRGASQSGDQLLQRRRRGEGLRRSRKAAEQNHAIAQVYLGISYYKGNGVTKDYVEAVKWYRKAAEQNHAVAQVNLGVCYANGNGVVKDDV